VIAFGEGGVAFVLQGDDGGGRGQGVPVVEQDAQPSGVSELAPRVAALATRRAGWVQYAGDVKAAQESRLDLQELGGLTHAQHRVVLVVEPGRGP